MITKVLEQHDSLFQKILEIIPGLLIWVLLLSPFWAGKTIPLIMADFLVLLSIYWLYRATLTTIGTAIGYQKYHSAIKQNWLKKCMDLAEYDLPEPETLPVGQFLPKHLIIYPQRVPQYDILKSSLQGLRDQNYPKELIYIAISFEERFAVKAPEGYVAEMENKLRTEFSEFSDRMMFFQHPDGIPGEAIGAAANRTWGAKHAVEELSKRGEVINDFLVTSPDEDIIFHKEYLAAATYQYLKAEKRKQKFYQTAVYTFNNNYWDVPILIRVLAMSLTIPVLASSVVEKHKRETYSCYTLNLDVMRTVNYWDTSLGIDDTTFYWRPFFYFKGDWECEVFFVPLSSDAVYDPDYIQNHREQYKQYVRWGWGVIAFPIGFKGLLKEPGIPLLTRLDKLLGLFQVFIFFKVLGYLLTFGIPLILFLNPQFKELVIWDTLPNTLSGILGMTVFFLVPTTIFKVLLMPAKPKTMNWITFIIKVLVESPLNIVVLLTYSFLPFVEASTRMMFGQKSARLVSWSNKIRKS